MGASADYRPERAEQGKSGNPFLVSKRTISRTGYGIMLTLLVFAAFEAFRIQGSFSERSLETYRQYVKQDEVLFQMRQAVWRGTVSTRDFFLSTRPDRAVVFKAQVQSLRTECDEAFRKLGPFGIPEANKEDVKSKLDELWDTLDQVAASMAATGGPAVQEFIQSEVTPRRSAASTALRRLTEASQQAVEKSELEFSRNRQMAAQRVLVMVAICVILGLLAAGYSLREAEKLERERLRRYEEVSQTKRELQQLSARLIQVQEEERARLSRELHDEIGQVLTALRMEISHSEKIAAPVVPEVRERLARARELTERAVQTVRDTSLLLRPSALDDLGLIAALQWQVEDFSRRSGIECSFREEGVEELLPEEIKTCVYRVVQEALHNCEKHSGAARIDIRLRQTPGLLAVEVEDNGRGMEIGPHGMPLGRVGCGILGMRERVAMADGSLSVASAPGRGVRLSLSLPLPAGKMEGNS